MICWKPTEIRAVIAVTAIKETFKGLEGFIPFDQSDSIKQAASEHGDDSKLDK